MHEKIFKASRPLNKIIRLTLGSYLNFKFNIRFVDENGVKGLKPPYLILANHCNFWDPFILSTFIPHPIYFLTSDFFFRNRILRFLLKLAGAIPKTKTLSDLDAVKSLFKIRNERKVIGIFPEGHRCWDGKTLEITYPTAKLIKMLKIPVVTCRMEGAYLSFPRWAKKPRRGFLKIPYRVILDAEDIQRMTVDEIYNCVARSLYRDEPASQEQEMIPFKGKRLAEHLELFLFMCPQCNSTESLESGGDFLSCSRCGYTVRIDEYGFFREAGSHVYFKTPRDWGEWQLDALKELLVENYAKDTAKPIFEEQSVILKKGNKINPLKKLHVGRIALYYNRIVYTSLAGRVYEFRPGSVSGITVQSNNLFEFYYDKVLYMFSFKFKNTSAHKWVEAVKLLKGSPPPGKTSGKKDQDPVTAKNWGQEAGKSQ